MRRIIYLVPYDPAYGQPLRMREAGMQIVVRCRSDTEPEEVSREGGTIAEAIIKTDPEYLAWVRELSERYRRSQIKAAVSVNREMLLFYWRLGKDIADLHAESRWGSGFFGALSRDLRKEIPDAKGLLAAQSAVYEALLRTVA